jgi:hypothetical protein
LKPLEPNWRLFAGAAAVVAACGYFVYLRLHRAPDFQELERRRRLRVNRIGRIVEGQVTELLERPADEARERGFLHFSRRKKNSEPNGKRHLVCYSYSISGVTYETAQDVTGLEDRVRLPKLAAGQSASVKYNPSNPSDSILVADDWSGVH